MTLSFRETLRSYIPPWLKDRLNLEKTTAFRVLYSIGWLADLGMQHAFEGLQARFPGIGTPTALPYLGRDRVVFRGFAESDDAFARRLIDWRDKRSGSPFAIIKNLQGYLAPFPVRVRIVNQTGTWYERLADGTETTWQTWPASNWDWDGDASRPTRFAVLISADSLWETDGTWNDPGTWDDGGTWDSTITEAQASSLRAIVDQFKCSGDVCISIILAFDPDSFDETAPPLSPGLPDGTWGHWSIEDLNSRTRVASRLGTASYADGVA